MIQLGIFLTPLFLPPGFIIAIDTKTLNLKSDKVNDLWYEPISLYQSTGD